MPASSAVAECVKLIRDRWTERPRAAIVLGTGLGGLVEHVHSEAAIPFEEFPHFPHPTAMGHRGQFICGHLNDVPVVVLEGRVHYYEGFNFEQITLPVRVAAELGCDVLLVSNASGGLNPRLASGDILVIDSHIDLMGTRNCVDRVSAGQSPRQPRPLPYDEQLISLAMEIARVHNFICHRGVYVAVTGPNYETRAEYRWMRRIGGDAVGMSTVPEVVAAARCGLRVLALSAVTNVACPDDPDTVDASQVVDIASHAEPKLRALASGVLQALYG